MRGIRRVLNDKNMKQQPDISKFVALWLRRNQIQLMTIERLAYLKLHIAILISFANNMNQSKLKVVSHYIRWFKQVFGLLNNRIGSVIKANKNYKHNSLVFRQSFPLTYKLQREY